MALLFQIAQTLSQGFQAFKARYPRREAWKDAEKAWGQVVKDNTETEHQIHAALDWQIPYWESLDWYTPPLPATYLRQERFTDEPPTRPKPKAPPVPVLKLAGDPWDQQRRTAEAQRLMREEYLSREDAIARAFRKD